MNFEFTSDQHCFNDVVAFAFVAMNMGSERLAKMLGMSVQQMQRRTFEPFGLGWS